MKLTIGLLAVGMISLSIGQAHAAANCTDLSGTYSYRAGDCNDPNTGTDDVGSVGWNSDGSGAVLIETGAFTLKQTGCESIDVYQNGSLVGAALAGFQDGAKGESLTATGFSSQKSSNQSYSCSPIKLGIACGDEHLNIQIQIGTDQSGNLVSTYDESDSQLSMIFPQNSSTHRKCVFQKN